MRTIAKSLLRAAARSEWSWSVLRSTFIQAAEYAKWERYQFDDSERRAYYEFNASFAKLISPSLEVRHGPFKGMKYVDATSVCGPFLPRLLGSYERELHTVLERICEGSYTEIIDIGCAEGYYAIGLARRIVCAQVYAYDISDKARQACAAMAALNGVASRVNIRECCSDEALATFPFTGRGLVVCDCEGYERDLFSHTAVRNLINCDVLVELHDIWDIEVSSHVLAAFSATHDVTLIESIDDRKKARTYDFPELQKLPLATRKRLVAECRAEIMEWAFFTPKREQEPE